MLKVNEINYWQNKSRLKFLTEFRNEVDLYFENSEGSWMANARIEHKKAKAARTKINRMVDKAHNFIILSDTSPYIQYTPPPVIGGYIQNINVII